MKKGVILVSGGLDSATVLAIAKSEGYDIYAISFDYGQRHKFELQAVDKVIKAANVREHKIINIDLRTFGASSLTSDEIKVKKIASEEELSTDIPSTYVPARNTIFLSYALGYAESIGAYDIFLGINAIDYSNYPDCRPEYLSAFENMANLATREGVEGRKIKFHAPLIKMTKAEIIKTGLSLGVDYSNTSSCYDPNEYGEACGKCESCTLRLKGFKDLGIVDPIKYAV